MTERTNPTAPPRASSGHNRLRLLILGPLAWLRFLIILAAIGFAIVKWDYLLAKFEQATGWKESSGAASGYEFFCPMHPVIIRDDNKQKCPICNMPLAKRKKGDPSDDTLPAGIVSRVQLSPYRVILAGAKTTPVAYQPLARDITTIGRIDFDERGLKKISTRTKGYIEKLLVNETGQLVTKGQDLAKFYSPEFANTVEALLNAHKDGRKEAENMHRQRLIRLEVDEPQIDKIIADGKPVTQMIIRSLYTGHVLKVSVREGQSVEEGALLYDIADISTVWVQAQLYEDDLAFLPKSTHDPKSGPADKKLHVMASARALPGRVFEGMLSFVFPHLDEQSRTLTVRFVLDNEKHELRPGMTANVHLHLDARTLAELPIGRQLKMVDGKILAVPERCIIDTGDRKIVYRETVPMQFDGVEVTLGPRMTGPGGEVFYPLLDDSPEERARLRGAAALAAGRLPMFLLDAADERAKNMLRPNDLVVSNGSFLIDAETRLNPALGSIYIGGSSGGTAQTAPSQVRPSTPEDSPEKIRIAMKRLPPADRALATSQQYCPVLQTSRLGSMGEIIKIDLGGKPVFLCCKNCINEAKKNPAVMLSRVEEFRKRSGPLTLTEKQRIERERYDKLGPDEKKLVDEQRLCPVTGEELLSMAVPIKVMARGQPVMICCRGCKEDVESKPDEMLRKVAEFKTRKTPPKR